MSAANPRTAAAARLERKGAPSEKVEFDTNPESLTMASGGGSSSIGQNSLNFFGGSSGGGQTMPGSGKGGQRSPGHSGAQGGSPPSPNPRKDSLTVGKMFVDGNFVDDITARIRQLQQWAHPTTAPADPVSTSGCTPPDDLQFWLGSVMWFQGSLKSLTIVVKKLLDDGRPCRAEVSFGLDMGGARVTGQNPTSRGLASYGAVTLGAGDSLASIAFREYGRASLWRSLAEINEVDDPLRLVPGTMILLPSLAELLDHTG